MQAASPARPRPRSQGSSSSLWTLFLTCAFIVSRIGYYWLGVRFDASPLGEYLQYVDPGLLQHSLLQSVFYLHGQPPLFNLFLGIVLKLFPTSYPAAFAAIYLGIGVALLLSIHMLLVRTGVPGWLSAFIVLAFSVNPVTILHENWLFYTYPVTLLVSLSALFLQRYAEQERRLDLTILFALLTVLALTWSAFHLVYVAATAILMVVSMRSRARQIAAFGAVSLLVIASVYAKNLLLFGTFGCGAIYPKINLALMTTKRLPNAKRLVARGAISRTSLVPVYWTTVANHRVPLDDPTGIDVLDQVVKAGGRPNWHHIAYLKVADRYFADALWTLREHPETYVESVRLNISRYFKPASDTFGSLPGNPTLLKRSVAVFNRVVPGRVAQTGVGWHLIVALPLAMLCGILLLSRRGRGWLGVQDDALSPRRVTIAFCLATLAYMFLVTVLISAADQYRYRAMVTPCYLLLVGQIVTLLLRALGARSPVTARGGA